MKWNTCYEGSRLFVYEEGTGTRVCEVESTRSDKDLVAAAIAYMPEIRNDNNALRKNLISALDLLLIAQAKIDPVHYEEIIVAINTFLAFFKEPEKEKETLIEEAVKAQSPIIVP